MSYNSPEKYCQAPVDFSSLIQMCSANIQKITHNTAQIKMLLDQDRTKQDTSGVHEDRLHKLQHSSNQLAKDASKHIKDLGSLPPAVCPSEQRQQKIQKERLMSNFSAALSSMQAEQRRAAQRRKESVARAQAASRPSKEKSSHEEQPSASKHHDAWGQTEALAKDNVITEKDLVLIEEREMSLRKLESDIKDVNHIFKDLGVMIRDQGDLIDSIEANVESGQVYVEKAVDQLHKASQRQGKFRKVTCILFLLLMATVLAVIMLSTATQAA